MSIRFERNLTLAAAFGISARQHAEHVAVIEGDRSISYATLAELAGGVASLIQTTTITSRGPPKAGEPVGLLLDHGVDMVAAILGVLAAGRCYVPLDTTYPPDRLREMLEQAGATEIVTRQRHRRLAEEIAPAPLAGAARVHEIDELVPARFARASVDPAQPAYILFTSGSTGRPKGVFHSHRSVLRGIANHINNLKLAPGDRLSLVTSFSYDMAVSDLYGALLSGATLVLCDVRTQGIARLAAAVAKHEVTVYHSTPTVFRSLVDFLVETQGPAVRLPRVRLVLLGGEQTTRTDLRLSRAHFGADCVFVNGYGATEASFTLQAHIPVGASLTDDESSEPAEREVLPIGRPLEGYVPVLLSLADGSPLTGDGPLGPAELAIRSDFLALGYWGDAAATAERFGADGRLYRTGDVVRRLEDGQYVNVGRMDRQVKVRGNRVELGEVEAALESLDGVVRAVVVAHPDATGARELLAFVRPSAGSTLGAAELRKNLAQRLPTHMLPQRLSTVAAFPLTVSGKVDVLALLANEPPPYTPPGAHAPPVGEREELVGGIWCEVLGIGQADRETSFFDSGGNSLMLARLQYRLAQAMGPEIPLMKLIEHPTIAGIARLQDDGAGRAPDRGVITQRMAARRIAQQRRSAGAGQ
jgi:amino acid adenylation domain-containing protein